MRPMHRSAGTVWLFDLDDTLHDAQSASMPYLRVSFGLYIEQHLQLSTEQSDALRRRYWLRYGATLLGLVKHHGVDAAHFLHHTHLLPGLEARLRSHAHDRAALARLPGTKFILTNAPAAYAERVLGALGLARFFRGVIAIDQMRMFGQLRPKPDTRMLRHVAVRLRVAPRECVLVEDTLAHQKAARRVGMRSVWMQRWLRRSTHGPEVGVRLYRRPVYVCDRIRSLQALTRSAALRCG